MTGARTLASEAQIRSAEGPLRTIQGYSFSWDDLEEDNFRRKHEVLICGLSPATEYEIRVGGEEAWSEWKKIRTLPAPGSDAPWKAVIFGDSRSSMRVFGQLASQVAEINPHVVFFPGDIVGDGRVQHYWDMWFSAGKPMLEKTIFIPALGNHEYDAVNYFGEFSLPGDERYFILPIGRTHWVIWDDDGTYNRLLNFIMPRVRALFSRIPENVERLFMLHHQPIYSASGRGSDRNLQTHVLPLLEHLVPDAIFNAHCHNYERSCRIAQGACVDEDLPGTRYVVAAGAGANLIPSGNEWFTEFAQSDYHFIELDIVGTEVLAKVHHIDGSIIETWTLEAPFERPARIGASIDAESTSDAP